MLTIHRACYRAIVEHARAEHPRIACGMVAGPAGSGNPARVVPMVNAERSGLLWSFDPQLQLKAMLEMDEDDEEIVAVYRSSTEPLAYPSEMDIAYALPDARFIVVSTIPENVQFRSFHIVNREVTEEDVRLYPGPGGDL